MPMEPADWITSGAVAALGSAFAVLWKKINDLMVANAKCLEEHAECRESVAGLKGEVCMLKDHNEVQDRMILQIGHFGKPVGAKTDQPTPFPKEP